jgi:hypothetical protein
MRSWRSWHENTGIPGADDSQGSWSVSPAVDGFRFHSTRRAFEHDRRKDLNLQAAGRATMRITWRQIEDEPYMVVAWLAGALATASKRERARRSPDETGPPRC